MDKQQVIEFITRQLQEGVISKEEVAGLLGGVAPAVGAPVVAAEVSQRNLIHTFYTIGGIIVFAGVGILVGQNWDDIGFAGRVLVTLGISLLAYVLALLARGPEQRNLSQLLFALSAGLAPLGTYVLLDGGGVDFTSGVQCVAALVLAVTFGAAYFASRRNLLVVVVALYASWAYYAFIVRAFDVTPFDAADLFKWATMLLGIAYVLVGYGYLAQSSAPLSREDKDEKRVQNFFYTYGTLGVLGAGISFGGVFDIFYIALIFAAFYGSVYVKSRAMLGLGALFLIAHIINLTSQYFVDSIGWPVALIAIGFLIIGVGYLAFYLNKRFVSVA
ncbi:MAG: DUF2157 domain-containing protein [Candidatus Paceibacterota bacterium]